MERVNKIIYCLKEVCKIQMILKCRIHSFKLMIQLEESAPTVYLNACISFGKRVKDGLDFSKTDLEIYI